ncbi:MAG: hypothetical protein OQK69_03355 [Gammaproteobacteria bacterium]|nr:hypothetical protein [Gammaproteobacteria bacterium]
MKLFTITIHSDLFGQELPDDVLEAMAYAYLDELNRLLKKHGLTDIFEVEAYWARGSLVEWFNLILVNTPLVEMFSAKMLYNTIKEYKDLRESVLLISKDMRNFKTKISGKRLSTKDVYVGKTLPSNKSKKLESKKDEEKDSNK